MTVAAGLVPANHAPNAGNRFGADERDSLAHAARVILANCGVEMGPCKVNRLVRTFKARVERNSFDFFEFLANSVRLDANQRRAALANPEIARAIAYADRTGESAVNNVVRARGW